jgi:hypothetical protein
MLNKTLEMEHNRRHSCSTKIRELRLRLRDNWVTDKYRAPGTGARSVAFNNSNIHRPEMCTQILIFRLGNPVVFSLKKLDYVFNKF